MRRLHLVLAAVAILTPLGAAAAAARPMVTLIGDSVADKMERNPVALASLNNGFRLDLQTRGCRRLVSVYRASNKDIFVEPKEWPELVIADWDGYSADHPDWFEADGIHLTSLGARKLGQFIHTVLHRHRHHR